MRPEHKPIGDPCMACGCAASAHRVPHRSQGDPCATCGLPERQHHARTAEQEAARRAVHGDRRTEEGAKKNAVASTARTQHVRAERAENPVYIGIDGEGMGRRPHRYVLLAASNLDGSETWHIQDENWQAVYEKREIPEALTGLSTVACLEFLLSVPRYAKVFAFAFNYDLTMILKDLDNEALYRLFRPEVRKRKSKHAKWGSKPVRWGGYTLDLQGSKFVVKRDGLRREVWDVFKFYQCKFVSALEDWKVGDKALWDRMSTMKNKRSAFAAEDPADVRKYCFEECACMAQLAQALVNAHIEAGIPLKVFYGPGSSAAAMLKKMGILDVLKREPDAMRLPVAMAFFGGRFDHAVVGPVDEPLDAWDISSAYPYQQFALPCLMHGVWEHVTERSALDGDDVAQALVRYSLDRNCPRTEGRRKSPIEWGAWGPFPFRDKDGNISFPAESGGGWVYRDEYLSGERLFHEVGFREAWVLRKKCDCQPFKDIASYYVFRVKIGKEGKGIVVKLAVNSCYGKLAQSVGNAPYNSWLYAGMITSGTRAQILDILALHRDPRNMLMVATDGICTRELIVPRTPNETGTWDAINEKGECKPLGGWENKPLEAGLFMARPGIYFPLHMGTIDLDDEAQKEAIKKALKAIKGRGIGKAVLLKHYGPMIKQWVDFKGGKKLTASKVERFCGAKTSISRSGKPGHYRYKRASGTDGVSPAYGDWIERPVEMSFAPEPKREKIVQDGRFFRLTLKVFPKSEESAPYDKIKVSDETKKLRKFADEVREQPDPDFDLFECEMGLGGDEALGGLS